MAGDAASQGATLATSSSGVGAVHQFQREHPDRVVRRPRDLGSRIERAIHLQHHVRLARAQPDVADEDVVRSRGGARIGLNARAVCGPPDCIGGERGDPATAWCPREPLTSVASDGDRNSIARPRPSPDANGPISLKNRVIAEQRAQ